MRNEHNRLLGAGATASAAFIAGEPGAADAPMTPAAANQSVIREVSSWEGVSVHEHRMGGVGRRLRDELVAAGQAKPHHVLPDSGWVTVPMRTASEVAGVIGLFRLSYERAAPPRR